MGPAGPTGGQTKIAMTADGRFAVTWSGNQAVYAQRFAADLRRLALRPW